MFDKTYKLLQHEAYLAQSTLITGLNSLRKANLGDIYKGLFYSSFFQLSIGFERVMKLALIVDHMAENNLQPITDEELRRKYSHKIVNLYNGCQAISQKYNLDPTSFFGESTVEWNILKFLHSFGTYSRYYNLSQLTSSTQATDPLSDWWEIVMEIYYTDVSKRKRENIEQKAAICCDAFGSDIFTIAHDLNSNMMTTYESVLYHQAIEASAPHCIWRILGILKVMYRLLDSVSTAVYQKDQELNRNMPTVPWLHEFFVFLLTDRQTALRRKNWG